MSIIFSHHRSHQTDPSEQPEAKFMCFDLLCVDILFEAAPNSGVWMLGLSTLLLVSSWLWWPTGRLQSYLTLEKFSTVDGEYGYMHPFGILTQGGASSDNEVLFLPPHWRSYFWLAWRPSWHTQVPANKLLCTSISTLPSISYHSLLSSCASACCPCSVVQVLSLLEGAHKFLVTPPWGFQ